MTNHKEILRLKSLGLTNTDIAAACTCGRNTVTRTLARAQENGLTWEKARAMSQQEVSLKLFPAEKGVPTYKIKCPPKSRHEFSNDPNSSFLHAA